MEVIVSPEADEDLRAILTFGFDRWDVDTTVAYVAALTVTIQRLSAFPQLGRTMPEMPDRFRVMRSGRHRVFYRIDDEQILIVRVLHERASLPVIDD